MKQRFWFLLLGLLSLALLLSFCSPGGVETEYRTAEHLVGEEKYELAVAEFEKMSRQEPKGNLGRQALFRAALIQGSFLKQYDEAIRKFRTYQSLLPQDVKGNWEAKKQIGDILFSKTERYAQAIELYSSLLRTHSPTQPPLSEEPEFRFRIARSYFFLMKFDQAIQSYRELAAKYLGSPWAEKAEFEIATTLLTRAEKIPGGFQEAMDSFQAFLIRYPESSLRSQAQFGVASCYESLDQLDAAYHAFEVLRATYPSPKTIEIKLLRIRERRLQRKL